LYLIELKTYNIILYPNRTQPRWHPECNLHTPLIFQWSIKTQLRVRRSEARCSCP